MTTPFLKQVADHYFLSGDISERTFIFPNRRSSIFFRKHLADCARGGERPIYAPQTITIDDFFRKATGLQVAARVPLLLLLYNCYCKVNKGAEPMDEFIFWGDVLLADFSDIDKWLIDPDKIFINISEWKDAGRDLSYLSQAQRAAIEQFLGNFGRDEKDGKEVKDKFGAIWDILLPLYKSFHAALEKGRMAYDGMTYRTLAETMRTKGAADALEEGFPKCKKFVFVGLNALDECEREVLGKMRDAKLAEFCWDWPNGGSSMLRSPVNKAGLFMRGSGGRSGNVEAFPQAFELEDVGEAQPKIHVISTPSSIGQVKLLPGIIDEETAVVLPDETLLSPLLRTLPDNIEHVNITMGRPIDGSSTFSLIRTLLAMQLHLREKGGTWYFYHVQVEAILSNGLISKLLSSEEAAIKERLSENKKYYIPASDFRSTGGTARLLDAIFQPIVKEPRKPLAAQNHDLERYLLNVLELLADGVSPSDEDGIVKGDERVLELEFARACTDSLRQLSRIGMDVLPQTYARILMQMLAGQTVPFNGEPLRGLQVMGPLETRLLDFKKVVILSCNEGVFPRRSISSSFIPPELRRGFGLPTFEHKDAVWAYYFYRLIHRAEEVWLLYDSRTDGMNSGEESRYIRQLEYGFNMPLDRSARVAGMLPSKGTRELVKTDDVLKKLRECEYSASSLQDYLQCPARFYYSKVENLKKEDELTEDMDASTIGNVLHCVMRELYDEPSGVVTKEMLERMRGEKGLIKGLVEDSIKESLKAIEVTGRNLIYEGVIVEYIDFILKRDIENLECGHHSGYKVIGLEKKLCRDFKTEAGIFHIKGTLDRLDTYEDDRRILRVVDYKTGAVTDCDIDITGDVAEKVFEKAGKGDWPKIALQLYIYDLLVRRNYDELVHHGQESPSQNTPEGDGVSIVNSIYSTRRLLSERIKDVPECKEFMEEMGKRLAELFSEIMDPSKPFEERWDPGDYGHCKNCDFKEICRR